jgi:hypothetical protein
MPIFKKVLLRLMKSAFLQTIIQWLEVELKMLFPAQILGYTCVVIFSERPNSKLY